MEEKVRVMLTKKQYGWTLLIAVVVFIVAFIWTYHINSQKETIPQASSRSLQQSTLEEPSKPLSEVTVAPYTKVWLKIQDHTTHKVDKENVDASSLLGLNRQEVAQRFADYVIETFNEREVCLKKEVTSQLQQPKETTYILGISDDYVCIKEKDTTKRPIKIDYAAKRLSGYTYSILLNEEIEITNKQKEALLLNPSGLQKILQDYVGE